MSTVSTVGAVAQAGAQIVSGGLGRFIPEPRNSLGLSFKSVLGTVASVASGAAVFPGVDGEYTTLLTQQLEVQKQMQLVTLYSNVEKSRHETQMAAVRNIRAG